jgi:hypothetical protein
MIATNKASGPVLDPVEWKGFKLDSIEKLSHNTARYASTGCSKDVK